MGLVNISVARGLVRCNNFLKACYSKGTNSIRNTDRSLFQKELISLASLMGLNELIHMATCQAGDLQRLDLGSRSHQFDY